MAAGLRPERRPPQQKQKSRVLTKVMVLHEATLTGGIGAEIAAWIGEHHFESLDAPIIRIGSLDTPVPFAKNLEDEFLPLEEFKRKLTKLIAY